jgi:branched-chain amino acid transport system permease protein
MNALMIFSFTPVPQSIRRISTERQLMLNLSRAIIHHSRQTMDTFLQAVITGIGAGALDALLALGIVLIYRTSGVLNFAQAATGTLGTFVIYSASQGRPLALAIAAGIIAGGLTGIASFEIVRGIRTRHAALTWAVASLAIAILIQQIIRTIWGSTPQNPFPTPFGIDAVTIGSISITHLTIAGTFTAAALALGIAAALRWTRIGIMVRALADHPTAASLCGANVHLLLAGVWAIAGGLAAVAGFFAAQIVFFPSVLDPYFVAALIAAVLGGLRSLAGAFAGAILLEISRSLFQIYAPASLFPYTQTFLVLLLIAVLVFAPRRWLSPAGQRAV